MMKGKSKVRMERLSLVLTAAVMLATALPATAQSGGDPILEANGVKYACAGIGKVSRDDPR